MRVDRVYRYRWPLVLSAVMTLILLGCGGGSRVVSPVQSPDPGASGSVDSSFWDDPPEHVVPVVMRPQEPVEPPLKGVSWQAPSTLLELLPTPRRAAWTEEDLSKSASDFEISLPSNLVSGILPPDAIFSPSWDPTASTTIDDLAYAMYSFGLEGYDQEPDQTIAFAWIVPPVDFGNFWVGLGNVARQAWDWYEGPADGVLTIESFAPYIDPGTGRVLLALALTGTDECALRQIRVGVQELRGLGGAAETPPPGNDPPLFGGTLGSSIDLTPGCSPVNDQGQTGSCTAFATADGAYNYELGSIYGAHGWDFTEPFNLTSPRYLYVETGFDQGLGCPEQGRYTGQVVTWLEANGVATELNAPFGNPLSSGWCDGDWSTDALDDAALLDTESHTSVDPTSATGVLNVKTILYRQERPVIVQTGLNWDFMGYEPGEVWNYTGPVIGYHAMCIVGYDDDKDGGGGAFKVRNSWGEDWGDEGYCWIGYRTFIDASYELHMWCWTIEDEYDAAVAERFCDSEPDLEPPTNLEASDGEHPDHIHLTWERSHGATGYYVYRDSKSNPIETLGDVDNWDDATVGDHLGHTYWLKAYNASHESDFSAPDVGYLAQAPEIADVSPTAGGPGEQVTFFAIVYGTTPLVCNWNFGGGATPNTSDNASPQVTLVLTSGDYDASLTVTNDYGMDFYEFTLQVGEPPPPPQWLITLPDECYPAIDQLQIFYPDPVVRRNDTVIWSILDEEWVFDDEEGYNDILKQNGDEFQLYGATEGVYPVIAVMETADPGDITDPDDNLPGIFTIDHAPGRLVLDIGFLTYTGSPGDPDRVYSYKVFGPADEVYGVGTFTVSPLGLPLQSPVGLNWGVNVWDREELDLWDRAYDNSVVDGDTMLGATPDVVWFEFRDGWMFDYDQSVGGTYFIPDQAPVDNVLVAVTDIAEPSRQMYWELAVVIAGLSTSGHYICIHELDYEDWRFPLVPGWIGILETGHTYELSLDDPHLPGTEWDFSQELTVTGSNPNID